MSLHLRPCPARFGDVIAAVDAWVDRFVADGLWFRTLRDGEMAAAHYVYTLSNLLPLVRWTGRLARRALGHADDGELRAYWGDRLEHEVRREGLLAADLDRLAGPVERPTDGVLPHRRSLELMVAQERLVGDPADRLLLLAAALVSDAVRARLDHGLLVALVAAARRWGVAEPALVTAYHAGEVGTDPGDLARTATLIEHRLIGDVALERLASLVGLAMASTETSHDAWIDDLGPVAAAAGRLAPPPLSAPR
jgi:hypothetical protein